MLQPMILCRNCQQPMPPGTRGPAKKWCSETCRVQAHRRRNPPASQAANRCKVTYDNCVYCGLTRIRRHRVSKFGFYCQDEECRKAFNRARMRDWNAEHPGYASVRPSRQRYREEIAGGTRQHNRHRWPEAAQAADQRRRARKAGADCENFRSEEVYDRDRWICGICFEHVDPSLRYPDPRSASLDHIVPLSLGGGHTRKNTRCSHLECNVRRGAARGE